MSQSGKLTPNLDQQSTKMLNLTVLQRVDPFIEEILLTAAHVTFYDFNIASQQWSRKDVEGSLFVVKRNAQPRFQFIVMNRRNTENLVENLLGDFEYEVQKPYLLYRNASQEVNGIWFYNPKECEDVANLFRRILNTYSKVPSKPKVSSSKSEFEELEAVPNMLVIEDQLEPSATTSTATDTPEDSVLTNFFGVNALLTVVSLPFNPNTLLLTLLFLQVAQSHGTTVPNVTNSRQPYHSSSTIPLVSHSPSLVSSHAPAPLAPSLSLSISHAPTGLQETSEPISSNNPIPNLVKPSAFLAPPSLSSSVVIPPFSSSVPNAGFHPPLTLQRQHGTPVLQPFPPLTPPQSLTPISSSMNHGPLISRDKVQNALLLLVQDDHFIDMFYQALQKV